jgi:multidrug efflux pump subunit AcrB
VARLSYRRGFESLKRSGGELAVQITGDVDEDMNNNNAVRAILAAEVFPTIEGRPGISSFSFGGDAESQGETLGDVGTALPLALLLIYIILAWVFESYLWPLAVLSVIPFGLVGALFGHWALNVDITLMSIFGLFGLIGIVINDSIILVSVFRELTAQGMTVQKAAAEAAVRRSRPLVVSLAFGLMFGTFIVLFLLPAILASLESKRGRLDRLIALFIRPEKPEEPSPIL